MAGITTNIEGKPSECIGCGKGIEIYTPKKGDTSLRIEHESIGRAGDRVTVSVYFHSLECFQSTAVIEKWDGTPGFVHWAAEAVRTQMSTRTRTLLTPGAKAIDRQRGQQ